MAKGRVLLRVNWTAQQNPQFQREAVTTRTKEGCVEEISLPLFPPFNNRLLLPPSTGRMQPAARGQDTPDKTQSPGVHSLEHKQKNSRKQVYGQAGSSKWSLANTLHTFCNSASIPDQRRANHKTPPVTKSSQGDVNLITPPMDPKL